MIQLKTANGKVDLQEDKNNITLTASVSKGAVNSVNGQQGDVVLDIPAKTSQLENDSDFQNEAEVKQLNQFLLRDTNRKKQVRAR